MHLFAFHTSTNQQVCNNVFSKKSNIIKLTKEYIMEQENVKRESLKILTDKLLFIYDQAINGEPVDLEKVQELELDIKDKADAIIYVVGTLDSREVFLKKAKSAIESEIKFTRNESQRLRDYLANELDKLGVKKIMTKLHRVAIRMNLRMNPIESRKVKTKEELQDIDERCIIEDKKYYASSSIAKEIMLETGEIPPGFNPERKPSIQYKKGDLNEPAE